MRTQLFPLLCLGFAIAFRLAAADAGVTDAAPNPSAAQALKAAEKQFKDANWKEALQSFDHVRELAGDWHSPEARRAAEGAVDCCVKLSLWDEALTRAQDIVDHNQGRFEGATGERFLAGLYLSVPHEGTKQGGVYHRGEYGQGVEVSSRMADRKKAILHYEHARALLAGLVKNLGATTDNPDTPERRKLLEAEQIGVDFDLVATLPDREGSREEPEEDSSDVEDADYDQPREYRRYASQEEKPTGLPLGPDGQPRFPSTPAAYAPSLGDGPKIRFLLDEVVHLDASESRDDAASALLQQATIFYRLCGPDVIAQWNARSVRSARSGHPLPKPPDAGGPAKKIWELADDEAIVIAGGRLQVVTLPAEDSPLAIWSQVEKLCPKSKSVPDAIYARAACLQSREQFPQAIAEYERLLQTFPKEDWSAYAQSQIDRIRQPGVLFDSTGIHLPGSNPVLTYSYRNADNIHFKALRFDLLGYVNKCVDNGIRDYFNFGYQLENLFSAYLPKGSPNWQNFAGKTAAEWTDQVPIDKANRTATGKTAMPLAEPGAYIVEALVAGESQPSRLLVLITDIAILRKNLPGKGLIYVADAETGQPLANHSVRVLEDWDGPMLSTVLTTNQDGVIEYQSKCPQGYGSSIAAIVTDEHDRMAFSFFTASGGDDGSGDEDGGGIYIITDRPVYRPGATVKFRIWPRARENGQYQAPVPAGEHGDLEIYGPKSDKVATLDVTTDESGCVSGEYRLDDNAPLGIYRIIMGKDDNPNGCFRVEEYKKPEFEVTVAPAKTRTRLGEKVSARIAARYYFGAPVAQGQVSYKVYREDYHHVYWGSGEYDWLYGQGYGHDYYPYAWFPWWGRWGGFILEDLWPWPYLGYYDQYGADQGRMDRRSEESGTRHALRELVAQGGGQLKADGTYDVEFDTAPALRDLGDRDHRYTIEAEVRDASRRTITGQGDMIVTRQEFYAFAETKNGWYGPGEDAFVDVRTLTADNQPVATQGKVIVYRISYEGAGLSVENEEEVKSWDAETDADGRLSFKYPIPSEGQYRICYLTHDNWKQEVQANAIFWVDGPKFDGRIYRFNDLEIIADKRTYQPGDTAHLLANTAENNDRILFSDDVSGSILRTYRFIDLPQRSTVIDVPITDAQMPNFFVEATLIRHGRVHQEIRELFVPPIKNLLNLTVETDKPTYKPGEQGKIRVKLSDANGKPVSGHVTLTAFDESITYIQDEFGPAPKVFFYGWRRAYNPFTDASLDQIYTADGSLDDPENDGGDVVKLAEFSVSDSPGAVTDDFKAGKGPLSEDNRLVTPATRSNFADTALWLPDIKTDANGQAETTITFPDSLTTWRFHGYGLTATTQVGDGTAHAITTKNLLVRLEAPRFLVERDEAVLSANVHNYLGTRKTVKAELILPSAELQSLDQPDLSPDKDGNVHLTASATIDAKGEARFDWPVKVLKQGTAVVTVKALTDEESDAMQLPFPVLVHGINKMVAQGGSYRVADNGTRDIKLNLPAEINPEQTKLEVTLSPSVGGVMIDALPYLTGYPYGCVEQTMSRFYPSVLVKDTLKKMGTDLETVGKQRKQMYPPDLENRFGQYVDPVFDSKELDRMVKAGLERIVNFQHSDGGWSWWSEDDSSPFETAYVIQGLTAARAAGVEINDSSYDRGLSYLQNSIQHALAKQKDTQWLADDETQAYIAYVLALTDRINSPDLAKWLDELYDQRGDLNIYGKALLALACKLHKQDDHAAMLLENILQFAERDDSNETAWIRTPSDGWWFWWNNDIETNAWALKALVAIDPKNDLSPRIVKWLLNNRKNGTYWRSTRDTAQVIAAMVDYMKASGEGNPNYDLTVKLDGQPVKTVKVTSENFFTFDNRFVLYGLQIKPGPHVITLEKNGPGALYYSAYLSYFTKEEDIKGAGNEISIAREYYRLKPKTETVVSQPNANIDWQGWGWWRSSGTNPAGQEKPDSATGRTELRSGYDRIALHNGDSIASGEQIEVVLKIHSKNTYDYLAFEDMKPAGCEAVDLRSGGKFAGGLCPNVELRDEKVVFFIGLLEQGDHILRYKLRAETPGVFHALPTSGFAMYAPEVRAISDEMRLKIKDSAP